MKKNRTTKIAIIVLALVLATSCFVGTTLAKYTTKITGADSARVAKWGVTLSANTKFFEATYAGDDSITVKADDAKDVVAPGTKGGALSFEISGAPEVDVNVKVTLDGENGGLLKMVTLPAGSYPDYTVLVANETGAPTNRTEVLADNYYPVKWTLAKNGNAIAVDVAEVTGANAVGDGTYNLNGVNLQAIEDYLETLCGVYEVESNDFANIVGGYQLSWEWTFGDEDIKDTILGNIATGKIPAPTGHCANETFSLYLEVTQVD